MELSSNSITREGYEKLKEELNELKVNKRKEIEIKLNEARAQGDLSENAEYDAAMDEQAAIEGRIKELENHIKNAEIIDNISDDSDVVGFGKKIRILDVELNEEKEVIIVGSVEVNIFNEDGMKISNVSPVGQALIGARVGETVKAIAPVGELEFKILDIA